MKAIKCVVVLLVVMGIAAGCWAMGKKAASNAHGPYQFSVRQTHSTIQERR